MKDVDCYWPWVSIVIDSQGYIKPCCIMNGSELLHSHWYGDYMHIETIDSLENYLLQDFLVYLREMMKTVGVHQIRECKTCSIAENKGHDYRHLQSHGYKKFAGGRVKFLEVTSSNICNQTCVTCNSYFSTKWIDIEHLFPSNVPTSKGKKHVLSARAIEKIMEVFPTLNEFVIKGGEPFSDIRNARMLERLLEVNPTCKIHITSNVSLISKKYIDVLKKIPDPNQIELHGSLDHIGKKYEWIRGASFDQTLHTMKVLYEETGIKTMPSPTISYFNVMDIKEIKDFYCNLPFIKWFKTNFFNYNILNYPIEMDYCYTRTQQELDFLFDNGHVDTKMVSKFDEQKYANLFVAIESMNSIRGFRWQDL